MRWLRDNPFLYDHGNEKFRDKDEKKAAWERLATELGLPVADLRKWYSSQRTSLGKLTREEEPIQPNTARKMWTLTNLGFLAKNISRQLDKKTGKRAKTKAVHRGVPIKKEPAEVVDLCCDEDDDIGDAATESGSRRSHHRSASSQRQGSVSSHHTGCSQHTDIFPTAKRRRRLSIDDEHARKIESWTA